MQSLPPSIREALPDHETLEERNEERIPPPADGDFHELLEEANEQYPDHIDTAYVPKTAAQSEEAEQRMSEAISHVLSSPRM